VSLFKRIFLQRLDPTTSATSTSHISTIKPLGPPEQTYTNYCGIVTAGLVFPSTCVETGHSQNQRVVFSVQYLRIPKKKQERAFSIVIHLFIYLFILLYRG